MGAMVGGAVGAGPVHVVTADLQVDATEAIYLGDKDTDGSWRIIRSGNNLVIQRLESSTWTTKSTINA